MALLFLVSASALAQSSPSAAQDPSPVLVLDQCNRLSRFARVRINVDPNVDLSKEDTIRSLLDTGRAFGHKQCSAIGSMWDVENIIAYIVQSGNAHMQECKLGGAKATCLVSADGWDRKAGAWKRYSNFARQASAGEAPALRSVEGREPARISFKNQLATTVSIYWIDYHGKEVLYRELQPGGSYTQDTFVSHPWRVRDKVTGKVVTTVVANRSNPMVAIDAASVKGAAPVGSDSSRATTPAQEKGPSTSINFVNRSHHPLNIYSVTADGRETKRSFLAPAGNYSTQTFVGELWRARLAERNDLVFSVTATPLGADDKYFVTHLITQALVEDALRPESERRASIQDLQRERLKQQQQQKDREREIARIENLIIDDYQRTTRSVIDELPRSGVALSTIGERDVANYEILAHYIKTPGLSYGICGPKSGSVLALSRSYFPQNRCGTLVFRPQGSPGLVDVDLEFGVPPDIVTCRAQIEGGILDRERRALIRYEFPCATPNFASKRPELKNLIDRGIRWALTRP